MILMEAVMLWKKIKQFWINGVNETLKDTWMPLGNKEEKNRRYLLFASISMIMLILTGCSEQRTEASDIGITQADHEVDFSDEQDSADVWRIEEILSDIYEEAAGADTLGSLDTIRRMTARLGENGYVAVDSENQVDMTQAEQALLFCKAVDEKESAKLTIIVIVKMGVRIFDFKTEDGSVNIVRGYYQYDQNGCLKNRSTVSYPADFWQYTEEGYLIFEGSCFSDEDYVLTLSDTTEHTMLRVWPLDEKCREYNRKYILPVGYEQNNLFLCNWSEDDFGELDFYDLFDRFYPMIYSRPVPYMADENLGVGAVYQVPGGLFENVIGAYLNIDSETLRSKTVYSSETASYEYRPRGFYEAEYPDIAHPEVVGYTENGDGTVTLQINAVYPSGNTSEEFSHITVIRPFSEDSFQYVSNEIILPEEDYDIWWHSNRLTEEEWKAVYGEKECTENTDGSADIDRQTEKGYNLSVDDRQRAEAEEDCMEMMGLISEFYRHADKGCALNVIIADEVLEQMAEKLKNTGCPVTIAKIGSNMENYRELEEFLNASLAGRTGSATVYKVHSDGGIGRDQYAYDGKDMYVLSAKAAWSDDDKPVITYLSYTRIKEWRFTDKGYFCYQLCVPEYPEVTEIVDGSCMVRVKPQTKENRELSEKCVIGLAYQGNNLLCSEWDADNMEDLDYNGIYEYLYAMKYQEQFPSEDYPDGIPKDAFECLIMEYLPVTAQEIQDYAVFDEEKQTYAWTGLDCFNYAPACFGTSFPEVTDIRENDDGTVTLSVDAVCSMILCDDAVITHELTIQFAEDGSFQYLGNKILDDGILNIPEYQYRFPNR